LKIYVASSWRNHVQQAVVAACREMGHEVYDFKHPAPGSTGFSWREIDPDWKYWTPNQFREGLFHDVAQEGFDQDMDALKGCDACILVLPCGRSAHIEAGYAIGAGKPTCILVLDPMEPELMYKMADNIVTSFDGMLDWVEAIVNVLFIEEMDGNG